jgi:serine protease Do
MRRQRVHREGLLAAVAVVLLIGVFHQPVCRAQGAVDDVVERIARRAIYEAARSVVQVELDRENRRTTLVANGTVLNELGQVLTAGLPAEAEKGRLHVTDHRNRRRPARWLGFDERTGLTLLHAEGTGLGSPAGATVLPQPGDPVFVIRCLAQTQAITSGTMRGAEQTFAFDGRLVRNLIEFAAPLSPGDAGALLANDQGEMIGIVRGRIFGRGTPRRGDADKDAVGVAIPLATALRVAAQLAERGPLQRGYLGVVVEEFAEAEQVEIRVVEIAADTPAEQAGLEVGDVILRVERRAIRDMEDLVAALEASAPGDRIALDVDRSGAERQFDIVLGALPAQADTVTPPLPAAFARPLLGLESQDLDEELRGQLGLHAQRGALVVRVTRNSAAGRLGLRPLDVIVAAGGKPVASAADLAGAVQRCGPGEKLNLEWLRGQTPQQGEVVLTALPASAEHPEARLGSDPTSRQHIRQLERRIEELEEYIRELERRLERQGAPSDAPPAAAPSDPAPAVTPEGPRDKNS